MSSFASTRAGGTSTGAASRVFVAASTAAGAGAGASLEESLVRRTRRVVFLAAGMVVSVWVAVFRGII